MITTRNRVVELERTLKALDGLDPKAEEILVTADGCTDGTSDLLGGLKSLKVFENQSALGSVASRDRMMRRARGDLVLALDDDSYPEETDCLSRIASIFRERPKLAVAHFPQRTDEYPETIGERSFGEAKLTASFANSGAVLRRTVYLKLPGFDPRFFHMYEEPDYALQCVAAGYEVLYWPKVTIRHHYSSLGRNEMAVHHRHARNELWSVWNRCPLPFAAAIAVYRVLSQAQYAASRGAGWLLQEPVWWWRALKGLPNCVARRTPVRWSGYRRWLELSRNPESVQPNAQSASIE